MRRTTGPDLSNSVDLLKDESLEIFLEGLRELDASFCKSMTSGSDFTLRLEIRGNAMKLLHCRSYGETIRRPKNHGQNTK